MDVQTMLIIAVIMMALTMISLVAVIWVLVNRIRYVINRLLAAALASKASVNQWAYRELIEGAADAPRKSATPEEKPIVKGAKFTERPND